LIDRNGGLPASQVIDIAPDTQQRGWWLATNQGLARVDVFSPVQYFDAQLGVSDTPHALARFQNRLYVSTTSTVAVLQPSTKIGRPSHFESLDVVPGDRLALLATEDRMLVGGGGFHGLDEVLNDDDIRPRNVGGYITRLVRSQGEDFVYAVTHYLGVRLLAKLDDKWTDLGRIQGTSDRVSRIVEVPGRRLWLIVSDEDGRYSVERVDWQVAEDDGKEKLEPASLNHPLLDPAQVTISVYDETKGVPGKRRWWPFVWQDEYYISSAEGLFRYDAESDRFVEARSLLQRMIGGNAVSWEKPGEILTAVDARNQLWFAGRDGMLARLAPDDAEPRFTWAIQALSGKRVTRLYVVDDGLVWASTGDGTLIRYDPAKEPEDSALHAPLLREIRSPEDERLSLDSPIRLPYSTGTMRVTFSLARHVAPSHHRCQYRLNGLSDDWAGEQQGATFCFTLRNTSDNSERSL
jgi:hypothetical protein